MFNPQLRFLLFAGAIIGYVYWIFSKARADVEKWAADNRFRLLEYKRRDVFTGPFFWGNSRKRIVYRVRIRNQSGQERSGWVRCRGPLGGGQTEVIWDETLSQRRMIAPDAGLVDLCWQNLSIRIGLGILVFGTAPLSLILMFSKDPNPNPIGPGMLAGLAVPVGIIFVAVGIFQVLTGKK